MNRDTSAKICQHSNKYKWEIKTKSCTFAATTTNFQDSTQSNIMSDVFRDYGNSVFTDESKMETANDSLILSVDLKMAVFFKLPNACEIVIRSSNMTCNDVLTP